MTASSRRCDPTVPGPDPGAGTVVLVGLMGSGKTTVGRRLAALLGRPFVDADDAVQERAGASIAEVFADRGEDGFRRLEADVMAELLAGAPRVVAAGGGAVTDPVTRRALTDPAVTVVFLDGSPAFLASRAEARPSRPLLVGTDARSTFERLHAERGAWYREVADIVVDIEPFHAGHAKPKAALAERIATLVRAHEQAASR